MLSSRVCASFILWSNAKLFSSVIVTNLHNNQQCTRVLIVLRFLSVEDVKWHPRVARAQGCTSSWLQGAQTDRFGHPPPTETSGGERRKEFISVWPTPGDNISKPVSKVLKLLLGLYKENVGQRWMGTCRWTVKVKSVVVLGSITCGLAGLPKSFLLEGIVSVPITGCFARKVFCLS